MILKDIKQHVNMKNILTISFLSLSINVMAQGNITDEMLQKFAANSKLTEIGRAHV